MWKKQDYQRIIKEREESTEDQNLYRYEDLLIGSSVKISPDNIKFDQLPQSFLITFESAFDEIVNVSS